MSNLSGICPDIIISFLTITLTSKYVHVVCETVIRIESVIWQHYCHYLATEQFAKSNSQRVMKFPTQLTCLCTISTPRLIQASLLRASAPQQLLGYYVDRHTEQHDGSYGIAIAKPCARWQLKRQKRRMFCRRSRN